MDDESGSTSPTSADVADKMWIKSEEPPADEPLALVKRVKIKVEPEEDEQPMDLVKQMDSKTEIQTQIKLENKVSTLPVFTAGTNVVPHKVIYTVNGVIPTVPHLTDLIPSNVNGKAVRPFKAYNANRELLAALPTSMASVTTGYPAVPVALSGPVGAAVPLSVPTVVYSSSGAIQAINSNGAQTAHLMTLATEAHKLSQKTQNGHVKLEGEFDEAMTPGSASGSDAGSAGDLLEETIAKIKKRAGIDPDKILPTSTTTTAAPITMYQPIAPAPAPSSKKPKKNRGGSPPPDPEERRDGHYWERRRKNNEAAKRSRDARRAKEDQIAIRAALLEQENMRLRIEVAALKEETVRLRAMIVKQN